MLTRLIRNVIYLRSEGGELDRDGTPKNSGCEIVEMSDNYPVYPTKDFVRR